ncbi:hypothetical protein AAGG74_16960 [Bacillus mexicanus]|uniref:hypothetical protein n=1 Tax=Bacillus mexicanus TaxID=2834415 RepID=UPI003D1B45F2
MNKEFQIIIQKKKEYSEFVESINIEELGKKYTREELKTLEDELKKINLESIKYELSNVIEKKKKEEYPELQGVHHYPVIKELDFLTENEKVLLDKHLLMIRKGNIIGGLTRKMHYGKVGKVENFLIEKGIAEPEYIAICPSCGRGTVSGMLSDKEKNELEEIIKDVNNPRREVIMENTLNYTCQECEEFEEVEGIKELQFKRTCRLVAERDKSLDNV